MAPKVAEPHRSSLLTPLHRNHLEEHRGGSLAGTLGRKRCRRLHASSRLCEDYRHFDCVQDGVALLAPPPLNSDLKADFPHYCSSPVATATVARSRLGDFASASFLPMGRVYFPKALELDCGKSCHLSGRNTLGGRSSTLPEGLDADANLRAAKPNLDDRLKVGEGYAVTLCILRELITSRGTCD